MAGAFEDFERSKADYDRSMVDLEAVWHPSRRVDVDICGHMWTLVEGDLRLIFWLKGVMCRWMTWGS